MLRVEQMVDRWEAQRQIKNLMGKYSNCIILNRETDIFRLFWSAAEDIALGFNDGWYRGQSAVKSYYDACRERNVLVAKLMQKSFPNLLGDKSDEELYGIGPFRVMPMAAPIIEIAGDGKTAKGLWASLGSYNDVEACGPLSHWAFGFFAVDFIYEADTWKIWHLQYVKDIDSVCGESWGKPAQPRQELETFAPLNDFKYPAFTEKREGFPLYTPLRAHMEAPRIPEPYETFADTFSYAI